METKRKRLQDKPGEIMFMTALRRLDRVVSCDCIISDCSDCRCGPDSVSALLAKSVVSNVTERSRWLMCKLTRRSCTALTMNVSICQNKTRRTEKKEQKRKKERKKKHKTVRRMWFHSTCQFTVPSFLFSFFFLLLFLF